MEPSNLPCMNDDPDDDFDHGPSKSELKRQSQALQELGEALIDLPASEFEALPLPDNLRDAVALARRITAHGGLYRQKQYIGKLMRTIDAEPIRNALEARNIRQRSETLRLRKVESWRARLIDSGPAALDELVAAYPALDREAIARLVEQALRERGRGQPPRASRELFGILRNVMGSALLDSMD
jgi:ribosome-associated protein